MTKTLLLAASLLAVSFVRADDLDQQCSCTQLQKDWFKCHEHHNRFFSSLVEPCCHGTDCHCLDR